MKVTKVAETGLPTPFGTFKLFGFESEDKSENVLALVMGDPTPDEATLVRIHSQCLTGDVFGSERCDCGDQLHFALDTIGRLGTGIVIYQLQEGRGIGLTGSTGNAYNTPPHLHFELRTAFQWEKGHPLKFDIDPGELLGYGYYSTSASPNQNPYL